MERELTLELTKLRIEILILALFDYHRNKKFLTTETVSELEVLGKELQEMYISLEK